eukprot:4304240-Amphidinium_carterae.1
MHAFLANWGQNASEKRKARTEDRRAGQSTHLVCFGAQVSVEVVSESHLEVTSRVSREREGASEGRKRLLYSVRCKARPHQLGLTPLIFSDYRTHWICYTRSTPTWALGRNCSMKVVGDSNSK